MTDSDTRPDTSGDTSGDTAVDTPVQQGDPGAVMAAAKQPVGPGRVSFVGGLIAVVVLALGVVLAHDTLSAVGLVSGEPWLTTSANALDGLRSALWALPVGILLALAGLWLLSVSLRPRPRNALSVRATTGVYLRPRDVERVVVRAVSDVGGVLKAKADASGRKVEVTVETTGDDTVTDEARTAAQRSLESLDPVPTVAIKTTKGASA